MCIDTMSDILQEFTKTVIKLYGCPQKGRIESYQEDNLLEKLRFDFDLKE